MNSYSYAFALAMGYNLDFPNSFNKTKNMFERALSYNFEDAETNLLYGIFLGGTTQYAKSIKFLEKAEHSSYLEAKYRLALVYLFEKDTWPKAQKLLKEILIAIPNDEHAIMLLKGIEDGGISSEFFKSNN